MKKETDEIVGKMVRALQGKGDKYALGFLEVFMANLIKDYVTDPIELKMLRMRMLTIGIDAMIDVKK
mgnify:CR=1 FL=1